MPPEELLHRAVPLLNLPSATPPNGVRSDGFPALLQWGREAAAQCRLNRRLNIASACWHGPPNEHYPTGWRAARHGCSTIELLRACGCPICTERAEVVEQGERPGELKSEPEPPRRVDVEPVRQRIAELLACGWSRRQIAAAAGVDSTTIIRALRPEVRQVHVDTSTALLALARGLGSRPGSV